MAAHSIIMNRDMFDRSLAASDLVELNGSVEAFHRSRPDPWTLPLDQVRRARLEGRSAFPAPEPDEGAVASVLRSRSGHDIPVRIIRPATREAVGTYLHFHGGGWVLGAAIENDRRLRALSEATGLAVASVDYRLAPEHPFPAAPEDCEDAALALVRGELDGLPTGFLAIGGESAGAHLALLTLIRLRDGHALTPFRAAKLTAGFFDLSLSPSARRFGAERLILNTDDLKEFVLRFVPETQALMDPAVSPLYADLTGLPPALLTVGTRDPLLDDTLFLATRWLAAGGEATLSIWTEGCHVFQFFDTRSADASNAEAASFLSVEMARQR